MPKFTKGTPKPPTSGKKKGTENVLTKKGKELFYEILEGEIEFVQAELLKVRNESSKDYLTLIAKFMDYIIPKKSEISLPEKINIPMIEFIENPNEDT